MPEFSRESFGRLGVSYVYAAIEQGQKFRRQSLHEQEITTANLTALTANINRDPKKQRTAYKVSDFCFYGDGEEENRPDAPAASSYHRLLKEGKLPSWALFVFDSFKGEGDAEDAPEPVAAIGDGVIVLAPEPKAGGLEGLLLATAKASGKTMPISIDGVRANIMVPEFEGATIAKEHAFLVVD